MKVLLPNSSIIRMKLLLLFLAFPRSAVGFCLSIPSHPCCIGSTRVFLKLQNGSPREQRTALCGMQGHINGEKRKRSTLARYYNRYLELSEKHPYRTKAISASAVVGAGAILSQWVQALSQGVPLSVDWHLVRSFALTGFMFEGPYLHWWYEQLFKFGRFLESGGVSSRKGTLAQIAIDETIGVVIFFPAYFFAYELTQSLLLLRGMFSARYLHLKSGYPFSRNLPCAFLLSSPQFPRSRCSLID